jgi:hypothetical protein
MVKFALAIALMAAAMVLGGTIEKHGLFSEQAAAWVQALGAIGAIAAAAWIALSEARDRRGRDMRDDARRGSSAP